ncbi:MAG: flagellar hook-basal body complex protein [Oscillibacter sp.]|nr:flagellar hook-basal body complex protein [Oscillibacter sp.]
MTSSMYAAVSGLKTHMSALGVIGNNVANVNTYAYKATRYTFDEALYTNMRSGSNGTDEIGGNNPAQIGFGCTLGTIDLDMSTKIFNTTGRGLDCMVDGDGFFIVGDKTKFGINSQAELNGMSLSRLGNFEFSSGWLTDGGGQIVYGFLNTANPDQNASFSTLLTPIRLPYYNEDTKEILMPAESDDEENPELLDNEQALEAIAEANQPGQEAGQHVPYKRLNVDTLSVDRAGIITAVTADDIQVVIGVIAIAKAENPNGVTHDDGRYYKALGGAGDLRLTTVGGAVTYPEIGMDGQPVNPGGGNANRLVIESAGDTELLNGGLESSGTDLADEITHMIVIQRGYQANTRIVTVTDSMLEELVNMKR